MESFKDHLRIINLERTIVFVFHFFLKVEPSGRLILTKNLYRKRFFCLVEMPFRNHLALCVATIAVSCRDKLLIQKSYSSLHKLNFGLVKTIFSNFVQTILPPNVNFTFSENVFFNECFILAGGNLFSVQFAFVRSMLQFCSDYAYAVCFCSEHFFCCWKT